MKFRLLVRLELPEAEGDGKWTFATEPDREQAVLWVLGSFTDFAARFKGSISSVELLPDSTLVVPGESWPRNAVRSGYSWWLQFVSALAVAFFAGLVAGLVIHK